MNWLKTVKLVQRILLIDFLSSIAKINLQNVMNLTSLNFVIVRVSIIRRNIFFHVRMQSQSEIVSIKSLLKQRIFAEKRCIIFIMNKYEHQSLIAILQRFNALSYYEDDMFAQKQRDVIRRFETEKFFVIVIIIALIIEMNLKRIDLVIFW